MRFLFCGLTLIVILAGCLNYNDASPMEHNTPKSNQNAQSDVWQHSIVVKNNKVKNVGVLDKFLKKISHHDPYQLKIIKMTTEGDPIYHYLKYDGKKITYIVDRTQDKYGAANKSEKVYCQSFVKVKDKKKINFVLKKCGNKNKQLKVLSLKNK